MTVAAAFEDPDDNGVSTNADVDVSAIMSDAVTSKEPASSKNHFKIVFVCVLN